MTRLSVDEEEGVRAMSAGTIDRLLLRVGRGPGATTRATSEPVLGAGEAGPDASIDIGTSWTDKEARAVEGEGVEPVVVEVERSAAEGSTVGRGKSSKVLRNSRSYRPVSTISAQSRTAFSISSQRDMASNATFDIPRSALSSASITP